MLWKGGQTQPPGRNERVENLPFIKGRNVADDKKSRDLLEEDFRKRSEISVSRTQKSDPLTRSKIEDFDTILAYLAYLAEDFGSQRSDAPRANKNLLYGDFEGLFTSQNLLPGKKILLPRRKLFFLNE